MHQERWVERAAERQRRGVLELDGDILFRLRQDLRRELLVDSMGEYPGFAWRLAHLGYLEHKFFFVRLISGLGEFTLSMQILENTKQREPTLTFVDSWMAGMLAVVGSLSIGRRRG